MRKQPPICLMLKSCQWCSHADFRDHYWQLFKSVLKTSGCLCLIPHFLHPLSYQYFLCKNLVFVVIISSLFTVTIVCLQEVLFSIFAFCFRKIGFPRCKIKDLYCNLYINCNVMMKNSVDRFRFNLSYNIK